MEGLKYNGLCEKGVALPYTGHLLPSHLYHFYEGLHEFYSRFFFSPSPSPSRFASRAKAIKNKPVVNEVLSDTALLKRYAREIKALQHTLALERNTDKNQEVEQVCL